MVETRKWNGMTLVRISSVPNKEVFGKWLNGQTIPFVEDELESDTGNPYDWAYSWDYDRFAKGLKIID